MTKLPKILYVIADSSRTGAPVQVSLLCRELAGQFEIELACPVGWLAREVQRYGVKVHIFDNDAGQLAIVRQLKVIYEQVQPTIIHFHGVRAGIIGRLALPGHRPKVVYTEHLWTNDFHLANWLREKIQLQLLRWTSRRTDYTVAVSQSVGQFLLTKHIASSQSIRVIYGAVEPIAPGARVTEPVVGSLGRLTWVKGLDVLIAALPAIIEKFPKLICLIGGDGPERVHLEQLAEQFQVGNAIKWLGINPDLANYYQSLTIYIQPSRSESFGLAPLEAMSAGVPVVASQSGALPEILNNGQAGRLFTTGDSGQLATAVIELLTDSKLRTQLASAGQKQAAKFTPVALAKHHAALYTELQDAS